MPKKLSGPNTKAVAAMEKKAKAKKDEQDKKKQEKQTQDWVDSCKKIERKEARVEKREEYLNRKKVLRDLLKTESEIVCKSKTLPPNKKVTRHDIQHKFESAPNSSKVTRRTTHLTESLTENLNRLTIGEEIARTIDAALSILGNEPIPDRHPEKRLKAAHKQYEEKRMQELREANPSLKLTQLREIVFKEWLKMQQKQNV